MKHRQGPKPLASRYWLYALGAFAHAYVTSVTAIWFAEGSASSSDKPAVQIKLSASYPSAVPPQPWGAFPPAAPGAPGPAPEVEFMQAWRAVLASLRMRPGAL